MTDSESNDTIWFAEHVLPHEPMCCGRGCAPVTRGWATLMIAVQEVLCRLLGGSPQRPDGQPQGLPSPSRNLATDYFRQEPEPGTKFPNGNRPRGRLDESEGIPETLVHHHDLELLTEDPNAPDRCRRADAAQDLRPFPKEIAAQLGIAEHTVEAQVTIGSSAPNSSAGTANDES